MADEAALAEANRMLQDAQRLHRAISGELRAMESAGHQCDAAIRRSIETSKRANKHVSQTAQSLEEGLIEQGVTKPDKSMHFDDSKIGLLVALESTSDRECAPVAPSLPAFRDSTYRLDDRKVVTRPTASAKRWSALAEGQKTFTDQFEEAMRVLHDAKAVADSVDVSDSDTKERTRVDRDRVQPQE